MILTLFGPAGAGKGTQASQLGKRFDLTHLSTGDLLRAERRLGTALGRKADEIINRGELVGDGVVRELVKKETARILATGKGIIYDGYPRNLNQLRDLEGILTELNCDLDLGISLDINDERLLERLSARRVCKNCHRVFNLIFDPPKRKGICDTCGAQLFQRNDDYPDAIAKRLVEYRRQTEPMLDDLRQRGKLKSAYADQSITEVRENLIQMIRDWQDGVSVS